jgi:hypothetical protein
MKLNADTLRALTPIILTSTGGLIAIALIGASIFSPDAANRLSDSKWASAMGLAGTAIGGAAGLAQAQKHAAETEVKQSDEIKSTQVKSITE